MQCLCVCAPHRQQDVLPVLGRTARGLCALCRRACLRPVLGFRGRRACQGPCWGRHDQGHDCFRFVSGCSKVGGGRRAFVRTVSTVSRNVSAPRRRGFPRRRRRQPEAEEEGREGEFRERQALQDAAGAHQREASQAHRRGGGLEVERGRVPCRAVPPRISRAGFMFSYFAARRAGTCPGGAGRAVAACALTCGGVGWGGRHLSRRIEASSWGKVVAVMPWPCRAVPPWQA